MGLCFDKNNSVSPKNKTGGFYMEKFIEQLKGLAKRTETLKNSIETEEATKHL